ETTRALTAAACTTHDTCALAHTWLGDAAVDRQEWRAAITHYTQAVEEEPTEQRWLSLANAASVGGAHVQAARAFERAARLRGGADAELKRRIDAELQNSKPALFSPSEEEN